MIRKFVCIVVVSLCFFSCEVCAQMKVHPDGSIEIHSQTSNWGRALYTVVQNNKACAYHLCKNYAGNDVFYVCAEGWAWSLSGGYCGSDSSFKRNITMIESPLKTILSLTGRQFVYKNDADERIRFGFVAQEVEQHHPELVKTMHDGTKALSYDDFVAILLEGIKEQQKQIENLRGEIDELKKEIQTIKNEE